MTDLLSQLEAATEGSGNLDLAMREWNLARGGKESRSIKRYSRNLQDAISLVPEGWLWSVSGGDDQGSASFDRIGVGNFFHIRAATPCLALCIAVVKAKQAAVEDKVA